MLEIGLGFGNHLSYGSCFPGTVQVGSSFRNTGKNFSFVMKLESGCDVSYTSRYQSLVIKASLSDYPKLPGKIWENSKARFIAVVRSHSLYECLSSKFVLSSIEEHEEHLNNCRFLKAAIALATTDGPCAWIPESEKLLQPESWGSYM